MQFLTIADIIFHLFRMCSKKESNPLIKIGFIRINFPFKEESGRIMLLFPLSRPCQNSIRKIKKSKNIYLKWAVIGYVNLISMDGDSMLPMKLIIRFGGNSVLRLKKSNAISIFSVRFGMIVCHGF